MARTTKMKILIVGAGNVGTAISHGLRAQNNNFELSIYDINSQKAEALAREVDAHVLSSLANKISDFEIVLLAIKPHDLPTFSNLIRSKINSQTLIISVLAGRTTEDIADRLLHKGPIIRAMPNLAALIACSATAMCLNEKCNKSHQNIGEAVFSAIGSVVHVEEKHLDAVTGLSGSGPAYIFLFLESLIDGGIKMGLTRQVATQLAVQTMLGSAKMIQKLAVHPAILRDQVTTPGGTTIDALHELEKSGFRSIVMSAVEVATLKAKLLAKK